jgi:hypothetical protein
MLDLFSPLPVDARREHRTAYRQFLADRDGVLDVERRTLSRREEMMARHLRPVPHPRPLDRPLFDKQYADFDPRVETSPEMLLLLAIVKTNAAEAYGVSQGVASASKLLSKGHDDLELLLLVEETYHTKILLSTSLLYGVEVTAPYTPRAALRAIIGTIVTLPEFMARPLTLAAEIVGTIMFMNLLHLSARLLKDEPELRDAVEERVTEILTDELGHISYNRMCLGGAGLAQARVLVTLVALGLKNAIPEFSVLGLAPSPDTHAIAPTSLPEVVRRSAYLA